MLLLALICHTELIAQLRIFLAKFLVYKTKCIIFLQKLGIGHNEKSLINSIVFWGCAFRYVCLSKRAQGIRTLLCFCKYNSFFTCIFSYKPSAILTFHNFLSYLCLFLVFIVFIKHFYFINIRSELFIITATHKIYHLWFSAFGGVMVSGFLFGIA